MAKILTSRDDEPSVIGTIQELIGIGCDVMGLDTEEPSDDLEDTVGELIDVVVGMANKIDDQATMIGVLNMDALGMSMANMALRSDLMQAVRVISALGARVQDGGHAFQHAYTAFTANSVASYDHTNGAIEITYREDDLRKALASAIEDYITEVARSALA
jgi:hypothetical protein